MSIRRSAVQILGLPLIMTALTFAAGCYRTDPVAELSRAEERFAAADYRGTSVLVASVLQADPGNLGARVLLGRLGLAVGDLAQAQFQLEGVRDGGAPPERYTLPLAHVLLELDSPAEALAVLDDATGDALGGGYWLMRGRALAATGDFAEAARAFEAAERADGETAALLVERARAAAVQGAAAQAEELLTRAITADGENAEAVAMRGALAAAAGRLEAAAADMSTATRLYETRYQMGLAAPVLLRLVQVQVALNDLDGATATARRLSAVMPGTAFGDYANALVAFQRGEFARTVDLARAALTKAPNQPHLMSLLGAAHLAVGNYGQAEQQFLAILNDNPADPTAVRFLAETRIRQQRPRAALEALETFRATDGDGDVSVLLLQGAARMQAGDFTGAIPYLEQARAIQPSSQLVAVRLMQAYVGAGRLAEAEALLGMSSALSVDQEYSASVAVLLAKLQSAGPAAARAYVDERLALDPRDPYARLLEATFREITNDRVGAEQSLTAALDLDPEFVLARLGKAALLANDRRLDEAEAEYQAVLRHEPANTVALLTLAQLAARRSEFAEAETLLQRAAESTDSTLPQLALARLALVRGDVAAAVSYVERASRREPASPEVVLTRAMIMMAEGRAPEAVTLFRDALALLPNRPSVPLLLAEAQMAAGDPRAGRDTLATAVRAMPGVHELRAALGAAELRLGDAAAALRIATELQVEAGQQPAGYALEAQVRMAERRYDAATIMFKRAFERDRSFEALASFVAAARLDGDAVAAGAAIDDWLAATPGDVRARLLRADWLQAAERTADALAEYARVIELDPSNVVALNNAAWYAFSLRRSEALSYARRAAGLAPESAPVLDTLGWLLTESGQAAEGLPHLVTATQLAPESPEIRYHLGVAQARLGQREAARATLNALLNENRPFAERPAAEELLKGL